MSLKPKQKLGPYEIVRSLGAGGMGEVFEARDTRLDRSVAIKVLPPNLAGTERLERFEREAPTRPALRSALGSSAFCSASTSPHGVSIPTPI